MNAITMDSDLELIESDSEDDIHSKATEIGSRAPKKAEEKKSKDHVMVEDDDVPSDFFDDFLNDDFMDGLDMWDDEYAKKECKLPKTLRSRSRSASEGRRRHRSRSTSRNRIYKREHQHIPRGRSREPHLGEKWSNERHTGYTSQRIESKDLHHDYSDGRRYPETTNRYFNKDAHKYENSVKSTVTTTSGYQYSEKRRSNTPKERWEKKISPISPPDVPKASDKYSKCPPWCKYRMHSKYSSSSLSKPRYSTECKLSPERSTTFRDRSGERYKSCSLSKQRYSTAHKLSPERRTKFRDRSSERYKRRSLTTKFKSKSPSDRYREKPTFKTSGKKRMDFLKELATKLEKSEKNKYFKKVLEIIGRSSNHPHSSKYNAESSHCTKPCASSHSSTYPISSNYHSVPTVNPQPRNYPPATSHSPNYHPNPPVIAPQQATHMHVTHPDPYFSHHMDPTLQFGHHLYTDHQNPTSSCTYNPVESIPPDRSNCYVNEQEPVQNKIKNSANSYTSRPNNIVIINPEEREEYHINTYTKHRSPDYYKKSERKIEDKKRSSFDFLNDTGRYSDYRGCDDEERDICERSELSKKSDYKSPHLKYKRKKFEDSGKREVARHVLVSSKKRDFFRAPTKKFSKYGFYSADRPDITNYSEDDF